MRKVMRKSAKKGPAGLVIGKYAHDCACVVLKHVGGKYAKKCYLDGFHHSRKRHKCKLPVIKYKKTLNSQACEQLWSRLDKLSGVTKMERARYRCFLRHYCLWRNRATSNGLLRADAYPHMSARKAMKRARKGPKPMKTMKK